MRECTNARNNYKVITKVLFLNENINKTLEERKHERRHQFQVWESVMREGGINTSHIRCTQVEPIAM